ncbi:Uncharacterized protein TPAR_08019 [Tolypocladium paradoxum]|uniref:DUF8004 domain-containing protein n=1 Tax=Tolypocladium paradoxum TaxID=94208 RepID=A0A2S4KNP1_9HYPO|nr:Uncharacterized protein TPAR_08019 [Tolypocladium paradoxum]
MTSSKSFRAAMLPPFALSTLRPNSDPDKRSRKTPRRKPSLDLFKRHLREHPHHPAAADGAQAQALVQQNPILLSSKEHLAGEPVPPPNRLRSNSKTWGARVSSLLPPLISHNVDPNCRRKPLSIMSPTEPPPPPPYDLHEPSTAGLYDDGFGNCVAVEARSAHTPPPTGLGLQPNSTMTSLPELDMGGLSLSGTGNPHIMALIPPSPETNRATLTKQQPPALPGTWRSSDNAAKQGKLQKENHESRRRSSSLQQPQLSDLRPVPAARGPSPISEPRGRSISAQAPSITTDVAPGSRAVSGPVNPPSLSAKDGSQSPSRGRLRRSWRPGGGRSRSNSTDVSNGSKSYAWVMSDEAAQAEYNSTFLKNGEKVPELWNENGVVYVYLYPRGTGCGPSFKVPEFTVSSSYVFNELMQAEADTPSPARGHARSFGGRDSLSVDDATRLASPPMSPPLPESPGCMRLYLPTAPPTASGHLSAPGRGSHAELDRLIAVRNLFAFLTGQPLVGTKSRPTMFQAFLEIAELLQEFGFSGIGGDTFGEAVDLSFGFYSDQLGLADCRHSREKTLEALILGERMRSLDLYNEAFAHAAGKYSAIMDLRLPLFEQVSLHTRQRLERAHLDLVNRQHNVNEHLEQFDFPSLFAGIANSTSIPELKHVRFKVWRNSFSRMRSFLLGYYKTTFGSWPPKASSKKNPFAESGLNRLVLKVLYSDMCALYDLLVDRVSLTSRVMDEVPAISDAADKMTTSALRNIMSEFDRSKPPVLPPIPFDLPQLPSMTAIHETFNSLSPKDQSRFEKKIKEHELLLILNKGYNYDTNSIRLPFLDQFKEFEMREAKGKMCQDLVDQRIGYWLFLYVVVQSLPMLVVDAPGLKHTDGVEYFLCQPPMGNPPWVEDGQVRKMWYEVTGGGGRLVELSADAVMFSVEATYHRSHCWLAAKQWEGIDGADAPPPEEAAMYPLQPPPPIFQGGDAFVGGPPPAAGPSTPSPPPGGPQPALRPRTLSPGVNLASQAWRSSIAMGLEPVPMEPPNIFGSHHRSSSMGPRPPSSHMSSRSVSTGNLGALSRSSTPTGQPAATSGATFDDILGETQKKSATKKKSRFF